MAGELSSISTNERDHFDDDSLHAGWRLACQASVCGDVTIAIPADSLTSQQRVQVESEAINVAVDPAAAGTGAIGLAVDLGTTKLAGYLVNLETGETIAQHGAMNPQIAYGEDVISRISYASKSDECRQQLTKAVLDGISRLADKLCEQARVRRDRIARVVIAGNTAMHHLFAGLPVEQLGRAPYQPARTKASDSSATQSGLEFSDGMTLYTPPNVAGYVGGDHVAMLLGVDIQSCAAPTLAIDIGTNTELTLKVDGRLLTCSCASGPAFEGAHIHQGMRAAPGAIERVLLHDGAIQFYTIDRRPACGICGSGILDAIAVLLDSEVLDARGNFRKGQAGVRLKQGGPEFVLADAGVSANETEITVSRQDICEIQLAKAAIRAGIDVLLESAGVEPAALNEFLIAGAFGSYLDPRSAIRIGLFPNIPMERIRQVGNASGLGARQMVASAAKRREAELLASRIEYIELTNHPRFHERFVNGMLF